jgi:Fic family protein
MCAGVFVLLRVFMPAHIFIQKVFKDREKADFCGLCRAYLILKQTMSNAAENLDRLLKEVDALQKEIEALRPMRHEDEDRLWKKLRLEWNYNSNHIEGNTLTYQETELVLIFDQAPGGSHTVREIEEMKAHDVAVALVRDWASDEKRELSEADIRDLNRILLVRPFWKEALTFDKQPTRRLITVGDYKKHPNSVLLPNGEMFHYASPEETPRKMAELTEWYRQASKEHPPVIVATRLHYDFVRIHPFDDGNGRVSRLLMNYHLLRNGLPPVVIKSADKKNYLAALQRADVGDFEAFVAYIAEQLLWSLDLSIRAAKGESVEEMGDWEKELAILEKSQKIDDVQAASSELIYKRMHDSLLPLYKQMSNKVFARIGSFYAVFEEQLLFKIGNTLIELKPGKIEDQIEEYYNSNKLKNVQEFTINIYWRGLKTNPSDANNVGLSIIIRFAQFQYEVFFPGASNNLLEKKYIVPISSTEQEKITDIIGKFLVEKIKVANTRVSED